MSIRKVYGRKTAARKVFKDTKEPYWVRPASRTLRHLDRADKIAMLVLDSETLAHSRRVAKRLKGEDAIAGMLHDVVEGSRLTPTDLASFGFTNRTLGVVEAVSRFPGEKYGDYLSRVEKAGLKAIKVKLADLKDNLSRRETLKPTLEKRYNAAVKRLTAAALEEQGIA